MTKEDTKIAERVYDRTSLYACLCFDSPEQMKQAQSFICILLKRGVIQFTEDKPDD